MQWYRDNFSLISGSNPWTSNQKNCTLESLRFRVYRADIKLPSSAFNIWLILAHNSVKWHKSNYSLFHVPFSSFFLVSLSLRIQKYLVFANHIQAKGIFCDRLRIFMTRFRTYLSTAISEKLTIQSLFPMRSSPYRAISIRL